MFDATASKIVVRHAASVAAALRAPRLSRAQVIAASGVSAPRFKGWVVRGQLRLDADRDRAAEQHRRFSALDAVRVALAAELSMVGLRAAVACAAAEAVADLVAAHAASLGAGAVLPSGPLYRDAAGRLFDAAPEGVALVRLDPWRVIRRAAVTVGEPLLAQEGIAA